MQQLLRQFNGVISCSKPHDDKTSHVTFFSVSLPVLISARLRATYCLEQNVCLTSTYKRKRFFGA